MTISFDRVGYCEDCDMRIYDSSLDNHEERGHEVLEYDE